MIATRLWVTWLASVQQRGAHVLCRLATGLFTQRTGTLADGRYLLTLHPSGQESLTVRVIEYDLHPLVAADLAVLPTSRPSKPSKAGQTHRLLPTLLDPETAPALELIQLSHQRWKSN